MVELYSDVHTRTFNRERTGTGARNVGCMHEDRQERAEFLWGGAVDLGEWDLDDDTGIDEFVQAVFSDYDGLAATLREVVGRQILTDEEPAVWATVQRLRDSGHERDDIIRQILMILSQEIHQALDREEHEGRTYAEALEGLPLPSGEQIHDALTRISSANPWIDCDELQRRVVADVGSADPGGVVTVMADHALDDAMEPDGPLTFGPDDSIVHVPSLMANRVLTRRLTEMEVEQGILIGAFDLESFRHHGDGLSSADGSHLHSTAGEGGVLVIDLSDGMLDGCAAGDVIAVTVDHAGTLSVERLDEPPEVTTDVIDALRTAYDQALEAIDLPVDADDLIVWLLRDQPEMYRRPTAPLSEVARAAGLEIKGRFAAHDRAIWWNQYVAQRMSRVFYEVDDTSLAHTALRALTLADAADGWDVGEAEVPEAADVLADLRDPQIGGAVCNALFFPGSHSVSTDPAPWIAALERAARTRRDRGLVGWLRALLHERLGELGEAEAALEAALSEDPGSALLIDRLAWYASDRGDAARAARLWRTLPNDEVVERDLANVEKAAAFGTKTMGRNEACWCGSGRKYKHCHLGSADLPPLPERVGWLCRKAVDFVERRGGDAHPELIDLAAARAVDPDDPDHMRRSFDDPLTMDLLLCEQGWFERFLEERGALLPEDELLLARAWSLVERSVYEVTDVDAGNGLEVRDLRSGERIWVRERSFSRQASPNMLICARAVPDGAEHQFIGGLFEVATGTESDLLDLLDYGDGFDVAEWVADGERGPLIVDRDGNPTGPLREALV